MVKPGGALACGPAAQREAKDLIRAVSGLPVTSELIQDTAGAAGAMRPARAVGDAARRIVQGGRGILRVRREVALGGGVNHQWECAIGAGKGGGVPGPKGQRIVGGEVRCASRKCLGIAGQCHRGNAERETAVRPEQTLGQPGADESCTAGEEETLTA